MSKQVSKTILESCPAPVVLYFELYEKAVASAEYASDLADKAGKLAPRERKSLKGLRETYNGWINELRDDAVAPNPTDVQTNWASQKRLRKTIHDRTVKKNCDAKSRKPYNQQAQMFRDDARDTYEVEIVGRPIKASKTLHPTILARLEVIRKNKNK